MCACVYWRSVSREENFFCEKNHKEIFFFKKKRSGLNWKLKHGLWIFIDSISIYYITNCIKLTRKFHLKFFAKWKIEKEIRINNQKGTEKENCESESKKTSFFSSFRESPMHIIKPLWERAEASITRVGERGSKLIKLYLKKRFLSDPVLGKIIHQ